MDINPLSDVLVNMFSHSMGCPVILLMTSSAVQKLLVWCSPICLFFSFVSLALGDISLKILLQARFKILVPMFSSRIFMVWGLIFKTQMRHHLTPIRMVIINKSRNNKQWQGHGERGTPFLCWWECRPVQPLWKAVQRCLKN